MQLPQFYRFAHPADPEYPMMIELFTRKPDVIHMPADAVLTPLPIDESISSLSAILLDDDYYEFLKNGRMTVSNITILDAIHLIPFKAKAWIDLSNRKSAGEHVGSRDIRKHKNDVFRLSELLDKNETVSVSVPQSIRDDMHLFIQQMRKENINLSQLGIVGEDKDQILSELEALYHVG